MVQLSKLFAPKEREFFDLFEEAGANIVRAAALLERMLDKWPDHGELARDIVVCEQEGDRITHDIVHRLNQTFVTPIDREDIYALASGLDDIVDWIEEVADFFALYRIEAPMEQSQQLARILLEASRLIAQAVPRLRAFNDIRHFTVEINRLENEGDRVVRQALASALDDVVDFIEETADFLGLYRIEASMDKATEMAHILHHSARAIAGAIPRLRTFKDIHHYTVEVNRLENDGDRVLREALASLFERGIDPMLVIRWKDIFERLEDAIDATESVANILEGIVIKNQ